MGVYAATFGVNFPDKAAQCAAAGVRIQTVPGLAAASATGAWTGPPFEVLSYLVAMREMVPQFATTMTGAYYLWWAIEPPGPVTRGLALLWCGALPLTVLLQLWRIATRRFLPVSHLLFASLWVTLAAECLLLGAHDPA